MVTQRHFERQTIRFGHDRDGFISPAALAVLMIGLSVVLVTFIAMLLRVS
jgi:hypothetical protein